MRASCATLVRRSISVQTAEPSTGTHIKCVYLCDVICELTSGRVRLVRIDYINKIHWARIKVSLSVFRPCATRNGHAAMVIDRTRVYARVHTKKPARISRVMRVSNARVIDGDGRKNPSIRGGVTVIAHRSE